VNLQKFLAAIRRYWKTFVAISALVSAVLLAWILLTPATFVSSTQLLVSISGSTTAAAYQNDDVVAGRIHSYIALLTTDVVDQRVVDKLKLPMTASELAAKVSATNVPPRTALIDVAVEDTSPERAQLVANTLANEFVSYTDALETPTGEDDQKVHTTVVSTATNPRERRAERVALVVLGAATALLLGAVAVWIRWRFDPVTRTAEDAAEAAEIPVIAQVTSASTLARKELEEYRHLRNQLEALAPGSDDADSGGRLWVLASPTGEVDVVPIASNLGQAFEMAGRRTVVLHSGTIEPASTNGLNSDSTADISDQGSCDDDAQQLIDSDVDADEAAVSAGEASTEPSICRGDDGFPDTLSVESWAGDLDPVATARTIGLLGRLRDDYSHVIVEAPPALASAAASIFGEHAQIVVLILLLSPEATERNEFNQFASKLRESGVPLAGVVISAGGDHTAQSVKETPTQWTVHRVQAHERYEP
jgi:capsular polysaccharide biosynthesis protein